MQDSDKTVEGKDHGWIDGNDKFWKIINLAETAPSPRLAIYHAFKKMEELHQKALTEVSAASRREVLNEVLKLKQLSDMQINHRYVHYFIDASKVEELQKED